MYESVDVYRKTLLFFIADCEKKSAKDIVAFAVNKENSWEDRKTAIYVMGKCSDVSLYIDEFIAFMKEDDYWIAHTALQAAKHSEIVIT